MQHAPVVALNAARADSVTLGTWTDLGVWARSAPCRVSMRQTAPNARDRSDRGDPGDAGERPGRVDRVGAVPARHADAGVLGRRARGPGGRGGLPDRGRGARNLRLAPERQPLLDLRAGAAGRGLLRRAAA